MVTIPIEAQVSTEQLLHAAEQLSPQELAAFVARLLELQAQRSRQPRQASDVEHEQHLAELATHVQASRQRVLGLNMGALIASEDFDEPLDDDFWLGGV